MSKLRNPLPENPFHSSKVSSRPATRLDALGPEMAAELEKLGRDMEALKEAQEALRAAAQKKKEALDTLAAMSPLGQLAGGLVWVTAGGYLCRAALHPLATLVGVIAALLGTMTVCTALFLFAKGRGAK